jgi:hypothetical protein
MRFDPILRRCALASVLFGFGLFCLAGCSAQSKVPVRGKLLYADSNEPVKELAGFDVVFTSEKLHVSSRGVIQEDGTFQLSTTKDNDGTPPGEYVVTVTQPFRQPDRPYVGDRVVEIEYEDPSTSDLRAEVKKGDKNEFTFKLRRIAKRGK